ncbi:MAG: hypothetical protein JSS36_06345 [Proteobacteria bacterium]|nr:hypothetical protein [Pseudomonadota bacterium]
MIGPGEIGALIPIVGMGLGGLGIWTKHQRRMAELRLMANDASASSASADHIRELEERVRVLERIVTDKSSDVAAQIEALRDPAPARPVLADLQR